MSGNDELLKEKLPTWCTIPKERLEELEKRVAILEMERAQIDNFLKWSAQKAKQLTAENLMTLFRANILDREEVRAMLNIPEAKKVE